MCRGFVIISEKNNNDDPTFKSREIKLFIESYIIGLLNSNKKYQKSGCFTKKLIISFLRRSYSIIRVGPYVFLTRNFLNFQYSSDYLIS